MNLLKEWIRRPVVQILLAVVALVVLMEFNDYVISEERRARGMEDSAARSLELAGEITALRAQIQGMESVLSDGADLLQAVERRAGAEGIEIVSSQSLGTRSRGEFQETAFSITVSQTALGPVIRLLTGLEAARPGLVIRELTMRRSIRNKDLLDVEFVAGQVEPTKDESE